MMNQGRLRPEVRVHDHWPVGDAAERQTHGDKCAKQVAARTWRRERHGGQRKPERPKTQRKKEKAERRPVRQGRVAVVETAPDAGLAELLNRKQQGDGGEW